MTKCVALLAASLLFLGILRAQDDPSKPDKSLSDLTGRIVLLLSKDNELHCIENGFLTMWVDADMGYVQAPAGKLPGSGTILRKELVPHADGLVLRVYGPSNPMETQAQKVWTSWHSEKARKFEICSGAPTRVIDIECTYGEAFSPKVLKALLALSTQPVVEQ